MHVCAVGNQIKLKMQSFVLWGLALLFLVGCSDRSLQIGFLNTVADSTSQLKIENESSGQISVASNGSIPFQISCGDKISDIEIFNQQTQNWVSVNDAQSSTQVSCASGRSEFSIPSAEVLSAATGASENSAAVDFKIRWQVSKKNGTEKETVVKDLKAHFAAPPAQNQPISNVNIANSTNPYVIAGACHVEGAKVHITHKTTTTLDCLQGQFLMTIPQGSLDEGANNITFQYYDLMGRTYSETQHQFFVDRVAPSLTLTTAPPTMMTAIDGNSVILQGTCSEAMMPVLAKVNDIESTSVSCSAVGTFNLEIPLAALQGDIRIVLMHRDTEDNPTTYSVDIVRDTVGPGAFGIIGIKEKGGSSVGNVLTGLWPVIDLGTASDATTYSVKIVEKSTQVPVCTLESASSSIEIEQCRPNQGGQYQIVAGASDQYGNFTEAQNSPFDFVATYHVPEIYRIYAPVSNVTVGAGQVVEIYVEYDREVEVTGTLELVLNDDSKAALVAVDPNRKKIIFRMTVAANMFVNVLDVAALNLNGGTIRSYNNNDIPAKTDLPQAAARKLTANNIKIDSIIVDPVTFSLGVVTSYLNKTPTISFVQPSFVGFKEVIFKVFNNSTGVEIAQSKLVSPNTAIAATLTLGQTYRIESQVFDNSGRTSVVTPMTFTAFNCPENFVYINNYYLGAAPFCIAKYEAKNISGVVSFVPSAEPMAVIRADALNACSSLGVGYDLPNNSQWQVVADLIYRNSMNWTSGVVGTGRIHRGNSMSAAKAAASLADPCAPSSSSDCTNHGLRRTLYVTSTDVLWDFAGNVSETIKDLDSNQYTGVSTLATYIANLASFDTVAHNVYYGRTETCASGSSTDYCGLGKIYLDNTKQVVYRGGSHLDGDAAGIYATKRVQNASSFSSDSGFRCVYSR